jgi:hypothetical protein
MAFSVWLGLQGKGPQAYLYGGLPIPPIDPNLDTQLLQAGSPQDFWQPFNQQPSTMASQWGEVAYFLKPLTTSAGGTPLFALYRRQRLMAPVPSPAASTPNASEPPQYLEVGFFPAPNPPGTWQVNDPGTITVPPNRLLANPGDPLGNPAASPSNPPGSIQDLLGSAAAQAGDDLLMTDVISFDIKVLQEGYDPNPATNGGTPINPNNFVSWFIDLPPPGLSQNQIVQQNGTYSIFDTWSSRAPYTYTPGPPAQVTPTNTPLPIRILAIQITLRVWDERTQQARQMTITQDM